MRKMMVLGTVVAALAMVSHATEARDRSFGFGQFSGHAGPKLQLRDPGFKFHHGGFVGKPQSFKLRHFGHFGQRSSSATAMSCSGSTMCRSSIVSSATGTIIAGCSSGLNSRPGFRSWHDRGFAFEDRRELRVRRRSMPGSHGGGGGGLHGGAPPEALFKQVEEMGFRHVPELLRSRDP
jgi:hypothetical protein